MRALVQARRHAEDAPNEDVRPAEDRLCALPVHQHLWQRRRLLHHVGRRGRNHDHVRDDGVRLLGVNAVHTPRVVANRTFAATVSRWVSMRWLLKEWSASRKPGICADALPGLPTISRAFGARGRAHQSLSSNLRGVDPQCDRRRGANDGGEDRVQVRLRVPPEQMGPQLRVDLKLHVSGTEARSARWRRYRRTLGLGHGQGDWVAEGRLSVRSESLAMRSQQLECQPPRGGGEAGTAPPPTRCPSPGVGVASGRGRCRRRRRRRR